MSWFNSRLNNLRNKTKVEINKDNLTQLINDIKPCLPIFIAYYKYLSTTLTRSSTIRSVMALNWPPEEANQQITRYCINTCLTLLNSKAQHPSIPAECVIFFKTYAHLHHKNDNKCLFGTHITAHHLDHDYHKLYIELCKNNFHQLFAWGNRAELKKHSVRKQWLRKFIKLFKLVIEKKLILYTPKNDQYHINEKSTGEITFHEFCQVFSGFDDKHAISLFNAGTIHIAYEERHWFENFAKNELTQILKTEEANIEAPGAIQSPKAKFREHEENKSASKSSPPKQLFAYNLSPQLTRVRCDAESSSSYSVKNSPAKKN